MKRLAIALRFLALLLAATVTLQAGCALRDYAPLPTRQLLATMPPAASPAPATLTPWPTLPPTLTPAGSPPPAPLSPRSTWTPGATSTTGCDQPGRLIAGSFTSYVAGAPFAYQVYLPPCYGQDGRAYPALYLLGGNIHDERIWTEIGIDRTAEAAILTGQLPELVVVMPDGGDTANYSSGGPGSYESLILEELIPHVEAEYCLWRDGAGRAIGGLSRGGYWALEIALRHATAFASVGGHSPALLDIAAGPDLNPEHTVFTNNLGDLRIYIDIGEEDYLRQQIESWHLAMQAAGIPHQWALNPGGHDNAYWRDQAPVYLAWYAQPWPHNRALYPTCS